VVMPLQRNQDARIQANIVNTQLMSAFGSKAEIAWTCVNVRYPWQSA
jgi:hypothetical protein